MASASAEIQKAKNQVHHWRRKIAQLQNEYERLLPQVPTGNNTYNYAEGVGVWFTFTHDNAPVTVNASTTSSGDSFRVDAGDDFYCYQINGSVWVSNTVQDPPRLDWEIRTSEFNKGHMNRRVPWHASVGTGQNPHYLPVPLVLPGGTTATIIFQNRHTSSNYEIHLIFEGILRLGRVRQG